MSRPIRPNGEPGPPIRVLHMLAAMERGGGIEAWLMEVARHISREEMEIDFLVHNMEPAAYEEELQHLGCRILRSPLNRRQPWTYAAQTIDAIRTHGPYDIVHSHHAWFSGVTLALARIAGAKCRIAHSHIAPVPRDGRLRFARRGYQVATRRAIERMATHRLAVSSISAEALYGSAWRSSGNVTLLPLGIDRSRFDKLVDRNVVRARVGVPEEAFIVGHVGRFAPQKNHALIVEVAKAAIMLRPDAHVLLLGDGPLRASVEQEIARAGISEYVTFAGTRSDVADVLLGAMDAFLFPSRWESLGLALLEAQAAGLPCVVSDVIPPEAICSESSVRQLSLDASAEEWARALLATAEEPRTDRGPDLRARACPMDGAQSARMLLDYYLQALSGAG